MLNETNGFYKNINESVFFAKNNVHHKDYDLNINNRENYSYPIDGWFYFDSKEDAYAFFDLEIPIINDNNDDQQYNNIIDVKV